jgi:hypothetical protein
MLIGIDYSITSPAICMYDEKNPFCFKNCSFYFLTNTKKYATKIAPNINGESFEEYAYDTERFDTISEWASNLCVGAADVALEGYAYGAHGKIFNLAENCGILKYKLHKLAVPVTIVEPSRVKKLATGKGNADKQAMYEAFKAETNVDLVSVFEQKSLSNPVTDIIDSYYILKHLLANKI